MHSATPLLSLRSGLRTVVCGGPSSLLLFPGWAGLGRATRARPRCGAWSGRGEAGRGLGVQEQLRREEDVYCKQLSIKLMARLEARGEAAGGAGAGGAGAERWRREAKELCDAPGGVELLGMIGYVYCQVCVGGGLRDGGWDRGQGEEWGWGWG